MEVALIASIAQTGDGRYVGAYIGSQALRRLAASEVFTTRAAARAWVLAEAEAVGLDVVWTPRALMGSVAANDPG